MALLTGLSGLAVKAESCVDVGRVVGRDSQLLPCQTDLSVLGTSRVAVRYTEPRQSFRVCQNQPLLHCVSTSAHPHVRTSARPHVRMSAFRVTFP